MTGEPEEVLTGGNMDPVVRIGDTVRRTTGPWTPAVHALLDACASAGIPEVPRVLGTDGRGREVLSFIPGDTMSELPPEQVWSRDLLVAAAQVLRRIHDATEGLVGNATVWRQPDHPPREVICHNDFAPYNLIVRDGSLVGVIDVDMASPGSRLWDVAYLAYRLAPFADDAHGFEAAAHGQPEERVALLVRAYGADWSLAEVARMVVRRLEELATFTDGRAARTGRGDLSSHAAMYRRDAHRLRRLPQTARRTRP